MNATAAPVSPANATPVGAPPAKPAPQGHHFGTDAVYKGYDLMVRKFATHIIREQMVTASTRADLVRAISSPAVTFAASAGDGSILISCQGALPETLTALAEPLDHGPSPTAATDKLAQMIAQIEGKLDSVVKEQQGFERISDRLEAIEYALRDRHDPEAEATKARALEAELGQIGHRLDMVLDRIAQIPEPLPLDTMPLELMQAASETRLMAALQAPPDFSPVIDALHRVAGQIAAIPQADQTLAKVEAKLDDLASRPVPTPDMTAHHQALAGAETALAALALRLDQTVSLLPDAATLADQGKTIASLATRLAETPAEVERLMAPRLNLTGIEADLQGLKQAISQTASAPGQSDLATSLSEGLADLSAQLTSLAARPQPVLDLTVQNDRLATLAASLQTQHQQIADLAILAATEPDLSPLAAQVQTVLSVLGQPAQMATATAALAQITELAARPAPVLDLGEPIAALAQITQRLDQVQHALGGLTDLTREGPDLTALIQGHATLLTSVGQAAQGSEVARQLTALADQIDAIGQPAADLSLIRSALDTLQQGLDHVTLIATSGPDLSALDGQFDRVITALGQPAQDTTVMGNLADLGDRIRDLAARPLPVLDLSEPVQSLTQIAATQTDLSRQIDTLAQSMVTAAQLDTALAGLIPPDMPAPVLPHDLTASVAQLGAQMTQLLQRAEPLPVRGAADLDGLERPLADLADRLDKITDSLAREPDLSLMTTGFDMVLAAIGQPAQDEAMTRTAETLSQMADHLTTLSAAVANRVDLSDLAETLAQKLDAGFGDLGQPAQADTILTALAGVNAHLTALIERPDPEIDMTAQRQSFARFGTALGNAVDRLEQVAATIADRPDLTEALSGLADHITALTQREDPVQVISEQGTALTSQLAQVAQGVESLIQGFTDSPDVAAMLMHLQHALTTEVQSHGSTALASPLNSLAEQVADLANRPEPVIDLSAQHQDFAQFAAVLDTAVHRLEHVAEAVTASPDHGQTLARIDALRADLAELAQDATLPDMIKDISGQIGTLVNRPDIAPDVSEQKQNLADFAKGMADLVQWLEPLTQGLLEGPDHSAILAEFDLLRAELNQPTRDQALDQAYTALSDQIADLAKSPDGLVSLAEQRRSFASFSNALAFMLQRLDGLGAGPVALGVLDADSDEDAIERLSQQVARRSTATGMPQDQATHDLADTLSSLILRLEFLVQALTAADPGPTGTEGQGAQPKTPEPADPAELIEDIATATNALVQIVVMAESSQGKDDQPPAQSASVAELFDRLDATFDASAHGARLDPALTPALHALSAALHGGQFPPGPQPADEAQFIQRLRLDFAECVARTLQAQTEAR